MATPDLVAADQKVIIAAIRRVDRSGDFGRAPVWVRETLMFGDYVRFGPPRLGVSPYNCYRLTERGLSLLNS